MKPNLLLIEGVYINVKLKPMFKKVFLAVFPIFLSFSVFAGYVQGGNMRYEFNGSNYTVYITLYYDLTATNIPSTRPLNCISASCSDSFWRSIPRISLDTNREMQCNNTSGGVIVAKFIDTVSLSPCTDWRLWVKGPFLSGNINNLGLSPSAYDLYLEVTLNNQNEVNSSAYIANAPPFLLDNNSVSSVSLQAIDPDGDSIALSMSNIPVLPSQGGFLSFAPFAGTDVYNINNQIGNASIMDNANQRLILSTSNYGGQKMMACKIEEYRNGILWSTYRSVWSTQVAPGNTNKTMPYTVPGTDYSYTTLWGQFNSITINFADSNLTDSVFVDFFPPNLNGFTFNTIVNNGLGNASGTISWITPVGVTEAELPYFIIPVRAKNNTCPDQSYSYYGILIDMQQAWPLGIREISAANVGNRNRIDWKMENRASDIAIESSMNGKSFEFLDDVEGNNTSTYWDEKPIAGVNYYRLKMKQASGAVYYSDVVSATVKKLDVPVSISAYPNPTTDKLHIQLSGNVVAESQLTLTDVTGKAMKAIENLKSSSEINLTDLPAGIFFLKYSDRMYHETIKIIKY